MTSSFPLGVPLGAGLRHSPLWSDEGVTSVQTRNEQVRRIQGNKMAQQAFLSGVTECTAGDDDDQCRRRSVSHCTSRNDRSAVEVPWKCRRRIRLSSQRLTKRQPRRSYEPRQSECHGPIVEITYAAYIPGHSWAARSAEFYPNVPLRCSFSSSFSSIFCVVSILCGRGVMHRCLPSYRLIAFP